MDQLALLVLVLSIAHTVFSLCELWNFWIYDPAEYTYVEVFTFLGMYGVCYLLIIPIYYFIITDRKPKKRWLLNLAPNFKGGK